MLVSFTQTYGNERLKLYEIYSRDKKLIELKNLCDINIHSFHNCSNGVIEYYKRINKVKNSEYLIFNNIPYSETISKLKEKLKELKCTHLFFTQDDTFSVDNDFLDPIELVEYIKSFSSNFMLSLAYTADMIDGRLKPREEKNTFNIFHLNTHHFRSQTWAGMDDSPYICTADILDIIYDNIYIKKGDVWKCEYYLKEKFSRVIIPRFTTEKTLFKAYNIMGRTLGKKEQDIKNLKEKGLYAGWSSQVSSLGS